MLTTIENQSPGVSTKPLSVVVLSDDLQRRQSISAVASMQAHITGEADVPAKNELASLLEDACDVLIIDLHHNPEKGLSIVETAYSLHGALTVMVCSNQAERELLMRSMRAGAREFLSYPPDDAAFREALTRASGRRDELMRQKKSGGRCLVFAGAKGGSGVTTIATNFAVALARESSERVALVDLNLNLGDAALNLGLTHQYSALDAIQQESRLDTELLSKLLVRHASGLHVLAASNQPAAFQPTVSGILKLFEILRADFDWVVIDAGVYSSGQAHLLLDIAEKVYLVVQVGVPDLRNANCLISTHFEGLRRTKLEVVLNRFVVRAGEIDETSLARTLNGSPHWKVPNDFGAVRKAQNTATALVPGDHPVARTIIDMARTACGKQAGEGKKKKFSFFG